MPVVEEPDPFLEALGKVVVGEIDVGERGDRLEDGDEAAVAEVVAEDQDRVRNEGLIGVDPGDDLGILQLELAARLFADLLGVHGNLDRRLEGRDPSGRHGRSGGGEVGEATDRLLRVGDVEREPALVVRREDELLRVVLADEYGRREDPSDDVGVEEDLAGLEVDRVDVEDLAFPIGGQEEAFAVGRDGRVLVVPVPVRDLLARLGDWPD